MKTSRQKRIVYSSVAVKLAAIYIASTAVLVFRAPIHLNAIVVVAEMAGKDSPPSV